MTQIGQSVGAGHSSYGGSQANEAAIGDGAKFQQSMKNNEKAPGKAPSRSSNAAAGGPSVPEADRAKAPSQEQVQKEIFSSFAKGLDPEVRERLSKWLPDVLNGGKKDLKEAAKDLGKQEAKDLNALSEASPDSSPALMASDGNIWNKCFATNAYAKYMRPPDVDRV